MATSVQPQVAIDWDGDGNVLFGDALPLLMAATDVQLREDVTSRIRFNPAVRTVRGLDSARGVKSPMASVFSAELDNQSQDYSIENAASPLVGLLEPGRMVRCQLLVDAATVVIFNGPLDDLPQHPQPADLSVGIPALGTLSKLVGKSGYSTPLYGNGTDAGGIRTDQALGYILDAIGETDTTKRVFDTGQTVLLWWWLDYLDTAFDAAVSILNSEGPGASLFEDGQGRWVFKNRFSRQIDAVSTVVQATLRDTGAEPLVSQPFVYDRGIKRVVNSCTVTHVKRSLDTLGRIWDPGPDDITLSVNEVRKFVVVDASGDPFNTATVPVLNTDYKVTAGSVASMTLDRTSGSSVTLTITAGTSGATIRSLELRAKAARVSATTKLVNGTTATDSLAAYGPRPYTLATRGEIGITQLQSLCDAVVAQWQLPRPQATLAIDNAHTDRVSQFARDIGHRITVVNAQTGLNTDMHIDQIGFEIGSGGKQVRMTLIAERTPGSARYFTLGTSTLGGTDVLAY